MGHSSWYVHVYLSSSRFSNSSCCIRPVWENLISFLWLAYYNSYCVHIKSHPEKLVEMWGLRVKNMLSYIKLFSIFSIELSLSLILIIYSFCFLQ